MSAIVVGHNLKWRPDVKEIPMSIAWREPFEAAATAALALIFAEGNDSDICRATRCLTEVVEGLVQREVYGQMASSNDEVPSSVQSMYRA